MARTKQEVRNFLNSLVGQQVNSKCGIYNGQCVSLIKALLEFLGAPNPYSARGNAKDVGDTLLRQGIAKNGRGWLTVCINRSMGNIGGVTYGHIWLDLMNEANFEQNGARALHTTKNTRPIYQAQQLVNLDQYIKADTPQPPKEDEMVSRRIMDVIYRLRLGRLPNDKEYSNNVGKTTADYVDKTVVASSEYQQLTKKVKDAQDLIKSFQSNDRR